LGSTRVVTDGSGGVKSRHDYLPFGEEVPNSVGGRDAVAAPGYNAGTVRQKFTGHDRDTETGLDFAQARYYSSTHGRFYSVDPHGPWNMNDEDKHAFLNDPKQWNRYAYVSNNPLIYTDPTGLERYVGISQTDEQRIRDAIDKMLKEGDADQKRIAKLIRESDVAITISNSNNPVSHTDMTNVSLANQLIKGGCDDVTSAAASFTITLSKSDANNPKFGTATIDTTLVHEGQHLEIGSKIIAGLATHDPKQRFDVTFAGNEAQSNLQAAYYMQRRGGVYHQLGLQLGLLEQRGGKIVVPAGRIRADAVKLFGKDASKSVLGEMVKNGGLKPQ
jgi:RHS repeat-associated protein